MLLRGKALHRGGAVSVALRCSETPNDPICIEQRGVLASLSELRVIRTDRAVCVSNAGGRLRLDLVEHLFAALGGLSIQRGVLIQTDSDELPLLDGGAAQYCEALQAIGAANAELPRLRIAKDAELRHGRSLYRFHPAPAGIRSIKVRIRFPAPVFEDEAEWNGDALDFQRRIATARTFGWMTDYQALLASGRALGANLESVLVFDPTQPSGTCKDCPPARPKEAAHHKLLDCIGDFALHGGPPQGHIEAERPGHTATHSIIAEALSLGVLV